MSDDLTRTKPEDPNKINKNQDWELKYWSEKFGVTVTRLKQAIAKVGVMVKDVEKEL